MPGEIESNYNQIEDVNAGIPRGSDGLLDVDNISKEMLAVLNNRLDALPVEKILEWAVTSLPGLAQVTSFGATGMVMIHMLYNAGRSLPLIFIDTLHHFPETIEHVAMVEKMYGVDLKKYHCKNATTKEEFALKYGDDLWKSDLDLYLYLAKVEPMQRALSEQKVKCWINGRRRDQGGLRTDIPILERDKSHRLKINPMAHSGYKFTWSYIYTKDVLYNPLYDQGFKSIGDYTTTARVGEGEDERSGRFASSTKTECGIHTHC